MYRSFCILLVSITNLILSSHLNPGHLKPFGSVGSLQNIEEINEYPNVLKLLTYYIPQSEPILSRQVLINDIHYNTWQTDEQLENDVDGLSKININVESLKQQQRIQMKFGDFIDRYQKETLFFADNVPEVLRKYLVVPQPLQCEAVLPTFQSAVLVMTGMNTSPLMFNEEYDHFLCLFRGNKRIVLVNTHKYPDVRRIVVPENRQRQGPSVNPDRVDFDQFPALANVNYYISNLTTGDCLFIPSGWIFQERSLDNTISLIYNIHHEQALNIDLNEVKTCSTTDSSFTLDQIDWSAMENEPQNLKEIMMNLINSKSNTFDKWQETFSKRVSFNIASDPEVLAVFEEFYDIVDVDGNGEITTTEVEQINGAHQHHISDIIYEMINLISTKQKTSSYADDNNTKENEEVKTDDDEEEEEDNDEQLHLQNYKTDL